MRPHAKDEEANLYKVYLREAYTTHPYTVESLMNELARQVEDEGYELLGPVALVHAIDAAGSPPSNRYLITATARQRRPD